METTSIRRSWRRRVLLAGALITALAIAVPALGAGLKTRSHSETFDTGLGTATAECKQGEKVISGGFLSPDFSADNFAGPQIQTYQSFKQGRGEWTVSGRNSGIVDGTLTAYAYCRKGKGTKTKTKSIELAPAPATGSATVPCGKGRKVVSGGSMSPTYEYKGFAGSPHPYESRKLGPRKWTVSANNRSDQPGTLVAYAYCRKGKGLKTRSKSVEVEPDTTGTATAKCKRGQRVVSGGFDEPDFDLSGSVIRLFESRKAGGRRWRVSGLGFIEPGTLTAYAYCEKKG